MKPTLLTSAIALLALSATAAPQTAQQPAPAEQPAANVQQQTISDPAPVQRQGDSPLVAASKRAGRLGKKPTQVITNDTLVKSGGHVTTTKTQTAIEGQALPTPAAKIPAPGTPGGPSTPEQRKKAAEALAAKNGKKETDAAKERALKRAVADYMGESIEEVNDDPAAQEAVIQQGAQKPAAAERPKSAEPPAAPNKPPSR